MALLRSDGNVDGPYSTFQCHSELNFASDYGSGYTLQVHRWVSVQGGVNGFQGTRLTTSWNGVVALYQTGTYAETWENVNIGYGSSYTMPSITAYYTASRTYRSTTSAQSYTVPRPTHTVRYNANGGTGAPGNQTKTWGYVLTLSTQVPTRTGYTFLGWATSSTATTAQYQPGGSYGTDADVTLYAVWSRIYLGVTFDAMTNGGIVEEPYRSVAYGNRLGELPVPTKVNNKFIGWFDDPIDETNQYDGTEIITQATRLYAHFELLANCYAKYSNTSGLPVDKWNMAMLYRKGTDGKWSTGETWYKDAELGFVKSNMEG